jgi:hypothetical protein
MWHPACFYASEGLRYCLIGLKQTYMGVYLRAADLFRDEEVLVTLGRKYLPAMDANRFRWVYRENPFGPARVWLALDEANDAPVGMAGVFPRRGYVAGAEVLGCVLGDFCISENYRSLGPAVQLQRACLSLIKNGEFIFYYDFPSNRMVSIYQYLGIATADRSVRLIKFLKADAAVRRLVPLKSVSGMISRGTNEALALRDRIRSTSGSVECRLVEEPCSEEYSGLAMRVGSSLGDCILRTPEYLNWRYRQHPSQRYELLAAYRGGRLQGYCFFHVTENEAYISDLFGIQEQETTRVLLNRLVNLLHSREIAAINMSVLASDPRLELLKHLGFWSRESVPVVSCGGNRFLLMHGDREG